MNDAKFVSFTKYILNYSFGKNKSVLSFLLDITGACGNVKILILSKKIGNIKSFPRHY